MNSPYTLLIVYAFVAIGFSFLCSIAEAVLLSVTPSYIASLKDQGRRSARLLESLKSNVDRPLAAILSLNTIAHTVGAAGVGAQAAEIWGTEHSGGHAVGWASAVMTLLILVLSEIIPKTIGAVYWRALAGYTAQVIQVLIWCLYPLVLLSELLTKLIGGDRSEIVTRDEVAAMAAISAEGGHLEATESRILKNLFRLQTLTVNDIMTPRTVMIAASADTTVGELLQRHPNLPVSRIPVYEKTIDHVTGFVLHSDCLLAQSRNEADKPLSELARKIRAVPATTSLTELFDVLLNQHAHLAIVHDEYGGIDGLVTLEDMLETLLGLEIVDEADTTTDMRRLAREQWQRRAKALGLEVDQMEAAETEARKSESDSTKVQITDAPPAEDRPPSEPS